MMRYQRLSSPDVLPHSNGRKSILRTCKEEDADESGGVTNYNSLDTKSLRLRPGSLLTSPSPIRDQHTAFPLDSPPSHIDTRPSSSSISNSTRPAKTLNNHKINGFGHGVEGDVLLRWGQRKRSRGSRTEARFAAVAAAAGEVEEPPTHSRSAVRIQRKTSSPISVAAAVPSSCGAAGGRATYLRSSAPVRAATGSVINKTVDDRSAKRSPPRPPEKSQRSSVDVPAGNPISKQSPEPEVAPAAPAEKLNLERFECPRIYLSLSRKEKEDDFLAMKGTKLPQRPKKRAKNIDRTLQYCFPGMWLSDLTRGRYEVREKKCVKKKRRGLKGMESSDSE